MQISIILNNIRSIHNVGSIFRTADAGGAEKIYLCGITPSPVDRFKKPRQQFTKVSLGAENYLKWEQIGSTGSPQADSTTKVINKLKKDGYKIFAIEQSKKSIPYHKLKVKSTEKIALILGEEVSGLPESILKRVDKILEIPMLGKKESLNVSVAFGIVLFGILFSDK